MGWRVTDPAQSVWRFSLDDDPPTDPSVAAAYWCEMDYFLAHTSSGDHPPCRCGADMGHNDPEWERSRA